LTPQGLVARLHAALSDYYSGGDAEPLRHLLTEDVRWDVPGSSAIAGDYRGFDDVLAYFAARREHAHETLRLHTGDVMVGDTHVAAITDGTAVLGGVERRWSTVGLYRVRGGKVAECLLLPLDPRGFDEVWS
jgi:ketosteroid isomerase-like protein